MLTFRMQSGLDGSQMNRENIYRDVRRWQAVWIHKSMNWIFFLVLKKIVFFFIYGD